MKENVSTILVWIYVLIAPYISQYMTQDQFLTIMTAVIGLILAVYSSYHPNTLEFLDNKPSVDVEETVLNDEYETEV